MHNTAHKLFRGLITAITACGVLPYIAYPVLVEGFGYDSVLLLAPFLAYNLMMVSFMCGALWSNVKTAHNITQFSKVGFVVVSVIIAIGGWFSFYGLDAGVQFVFYIGLFSVLLLLDFILYRYGTFAKWYMGLRVITTAIVFISLIYSMRFV